MDIYNITNLDVFENLEIVSLSLNKMSSLAPFACCKKLKELHLRKNQICDINEVQYVQNLPLLHTLLLTDNPICNTSDYRIKVISFLPSLVNLDSTQVTEVEKLMSNRNPISPIIKESVHASTPISGLSNRVLAIRLLVDDMSLSEIESILDYCKSKLESVNKTIDH